MQKLRIKRTVILLVIVVAVVSMIMFFQFAQKPVAIWYVENHNDELTQYAEDLIQNGLNGESDTYGWCRVTYWAGNGMVEFIAGGSGLGSSTVYRGIYYSIYDIPIGFQGVNMAYTSDGSGWMW